MTNPVPIVRKRLFLEPIHQGENVSELMDIIQQCVPQAILHDLPAPIGPLIEVPADTDLGDLAILKLYDLGEQKPKTFSK